MEEHKRNETSPKVATLNNPYTKNQIKQFQKDQKQVIYRRRRLALIFSIAAIFFVVSGLNIFNSHQKIQRLSVEKAEVEAQRVALDQNLASLKYDVNLLKDQDYLKKLARQKYYYSKEGELIFVYPQSNAGEAKTDSTKK